MAGPGKIGFLTIPPAFQNPEVNASLISAHHKSLNVFIPLADYYASNALTFGDFVARTPRVIILERTLQLLGELSNVVASYHRTKVELPHAGGTIFKRILAFAVKVVDANGAIVGRLLRVFWAKQEDDEEDIDLSGNADGPGKDVEVKRRKRHRDPEYRLNWMISGRPTASNEKKVFKPRGEPTYWYEVMDHTAYFHHFGAQHTIVAGREFMSVMNSHNPVNIHNLLSMERAIAAMEAAGAAPVYLDPATWASNSIGVLRENVWQIQPSELHWSNLKDCCFPDAPRPPVDQESPEFKAHLNRYYRELETAPHVVWSVAEEGADEHRKKQVADSNAAIKAELMAEAKKHAVYIMEQMSSAVHELSNLEAFRKSTKSLMEREMRAAGWQHDKKIEDITEAEALAIGKARLRVQRQQIRQLEIFRRRPVLSDTYKAIFNHLDQFLSNPANHKGKRFPSFWRDVRRPAQFSNLTEFGAFVAMMPLEQEAVQENYGVHKEAITALLAALHVYYTHAKLHPNCAMLGDPKAGKSFAGRQTLMFIPGTVSESMGETEKAKFASGQDAEKHFASKIVLMEELPPSMLGLTHLDGKSLANAKKGSAMSDVSSRWRHMATSMKISWDRLVQNQEKGGFDSEHVSYDLHQVIIGALNLPSHLFPENMLSRWLPLEFVQKFRTGMTLINRVLFPTPDQYSAFKEGTQEKMRMQQALLAVACMMMDIGIIQKPSFGSARGFIDEVVELATKRGVTGVADVRHVQRVTALMEVMCVIFAQWSFYSDPKSPAKDTPHSWEHFLMQEKMFSVSIEQAVFVLTLCENQFDNPLASAVLAAIKHTWDVGPAAGQLGFETYSTIQLGDFGDRKSVDQHTSRTFWCNKLYACIQEKMEFKPPKEAAVNYLEQLCDTQVIALDGKRVDALRFDSNGQCFVANVLLQGGQKDRFTRCVQEVLCRKYYPQQRYVLGKLDPEAPWIWQTFSNNPDDLETLEERQLFRDLTGAAKENQKKDQTRWKKRQRSAEQEQADEKNMLDDSLVLRYIYTAHEKVVWDILSAHQGNVEAQERAFRNSVVDQLYTGVLELIDEDREDVGVWEDWMRQFCSDKVWRDLLGDQDANLQSPSERRAQYMREIAAEAKQKCPGDWKDKCVYPRCFASRNLAQFYDSALDAARRNPEAFLVSRRVNYIKRLLKGGEQKQPAAAAAVVMMPAPPLPDEGKRREPGRKRPREEKEDGDSADKQEPPKKQRTEEKKQQQQKGLVDALMDPGLAPAAPPPSPPQYEGVGLGRLLSLMYEQDAEEPAAAEEKKQQPDEAEMEARLDELVDPVEPPGLPLDDPTPLPDEEEEESEGDSHEEDSVDEEAAAYEEHAKAMGYQGETRAGAPTGDTEDEQEPEVDSEIDMESSEAQCEREEKESAQHGAAEEAQARGERVDSD